MFLSRLFERSNDRRFGHRAAWLQKARARSIRSLNVWKLYLRSISCVLIGARNPKCSVVPERTSDWRAVAWFVFESWNHAQERLKLSKHPLNSAKSILWWSFEVDRWSRLSEAGSDGIRGPISKSQDVREVILISSKSVNAWNKLRNSEIWIWEISCRWRIFNVESLGTLDINESFKNNLSWSRLGAAIGREFENAGSWGEA